MVETTMGGYLSRMDMTYKKLCEYTGNLVLSELRNGGGYDELSMWLESISHEEILYMCK
jgi:hypothetical protein